MKLELYKDAVLTRDIPEDSLKRFDIVKLVDHHVAPDGTKGYSIEVLNALGETIAVTAVPATALEPLREDEILCARVLPEQLTYELFTRIALKDDLPAHGLRKGDLATIVEYHEGKSGQEPGYSLEVFSRRDGLPNAIGDTVAVVTVHESQLEPLTSSELLHVRAFAV